MDNRKIEIEISHELGKTLLDNGEKFCKDILHAMLSYTLKRRVPELEPKESIFFSLIKAELDEKREKEKLSEKRRKAAMKRYETEKSKILAQ